MEPVTSSPHNDGVARVAATVVARDGIEAIGEVVDNLPLSFVAPLEADDRQILPRSSS